MRLHAAHALATKARGKTHSALEVETSHELHAARHNCQPARRRQDEYWNTDLGIDLGVLQSSAGISESKGEESKNVVFGDVGARSGMRRGSSESAR